jgi:predicted Zn-dependent peptidase
MHLKGVFGMWNGGPVPVRPTYNPPRVPATRIELRQEAVSSTCVMLTFPGPGAADPDFLALRLLDTVLSAGTSSRLFREVREARRLAYDVSTSFPPQQACSHMSLYAVVSQFRMEDAKAALVDVVSVLQTTPIPPEELARAKAYLKGRYLLSHQYSAQHAFDLAWYETIGLGADLDGQFAQRVDALTSEDLQRVARAWFTRYYLVVVMPNNAATEALPGVG